MEDKSCQIQTFVWSNLSLPELPKLSTAYFLLHRLLHKWSSQHSEQCVCPVLWDNAWHFLEEKEKFFNKNEWSYISAFTAQMSIATLRTMRLSFTLWQCLAFPVREREKWHVLYQCSCTYFSSKRKILWLKAHHRCWKFGFSLIWHFWDITFQLFQNTLFCLRITDNGSVTEISIMSILVNESDLKWCIRLSRSKIEVSRDVRNSKVRKHDKFRKERSQH